VGTKTITMYVSDIDESEIPAGQAYQLSIRHPDGSTQQLDISEKNYRDLTLAGVGKTLKKRGRKPGSTTRANGGSRTPRPAPEQQAVRHRLTQERRIRPVVVQWHPGRALHALTTLAPVQLRDGRISGCPRREGRSPREAVGAQKPWRWSWRRPGSQGPAAPRGCAGSPSVGSRWPAARSEMAPAGEPMAGRVPALDRSSAGPPCDGAPR
jgi:hypothetical protein